MSDWQPIETAPRDGRPVLIAYLNSHGRSRVIKARYVERFSEESSGDADEDGCEYSEELDTYFMPEGWWECVDNWDDYCDVAVHEGTPSHWQPLPAPPSEGEGSREQSGL